MPTYRCYFLDYQHHIETAKNMEVDCLDEAIERALVMLEARPYNHCIEIWQGAVRLYASEERVARHQCHIYEGPPSQTLPAMAAVIKTRLMENTRCMYLNNPSMVTGLQFHLTGAGVHVEKEIEKGSLILSSDREYLAEGSFNADLILDLLEDAVDQAVRDGYRGLWATGDLTWELGPQQSNVDLLEYEWRLEEVFRRRAAFSGICQYHRDTLPRDLVRQGLVAHPSIFVNETLSRVNPHYVQSTLGSRPNTANRKLDAFIDRLGRGVCPPK
jgi:MEDS: MEthanogen/methylotroph, DcmR Sensory domain